MLIFIGTQFSHSLGNTAFCHHLPGLLDSLLRDMETRDITGVRPFGRLIHYC